VGRYRADTSSSYGTAGTKTRHRHQPQTPIRIQTQVQRDMYTSRMCPFDTPCTQTLLSFMLLEVFQYAMSRRSHFNIHLYTSGNV
jgi:hypothetical protein